MDKEQQLAPLGYHLARLPVPPKVPAGFFVAIIVIVVVIIYTFFIVIMTFAHRLAKCFCGASCCAVLSP